MPIIYSYPSKTSPASGDLLLISDVSASNQTKKSTIGEVATTIQATLGLVDGSGTLNKISKWSDANTLTDSIITEDPAGPGISIPGTLSVTGGGNYLSIPSILDNFGSQGTANQVLTASGAGGSIEWQAAATDTTIDTRNGGVSVANPTTSLDFGTALTAISGGGGAAAISFSGGINDLSDVSYPGTNDASMYIGNGVPTGLIGTPIKNTALGEGAGTGTTSGSSNTSIGTNAGRLITTGSTNCILGDDAGDTLETGASNVIIGSSADSNSNSVNASVAIGKSTVVSTGSVAIGESASATGSGIALGRGATNTTANLALGSATYPLLNTTDVGDVIGLAAGQAPTKFIEVQIGASKYYMALYDQA